MEALHCNLSANEELQTPLPIEPCACCMEQAIFFFFFKVGENKENAIRSITLGEHVCLLVAGLEKQADVRLA